VMRLCSCVPVFLCSCVPVKQALARFLCEDDVFSFFFPVPFPLTWCAASPILQGGEG